MRSLHALPRGLLLGLMVALGGACHAAPGVLGEGDTDTGVAFKGQRGFVTSEVSTGNKSMDMLLEARLPPAQTSTAASAASAASPDTSLASPAIVGVNASIQGANVQDALRLQVAEFAKANAPSQSESDMIDRASDAQQRVSTSGALSDLAADRAAPRWMSWPRALFAFIREEREWVLGFCLLVLAATGFAFARQDRSGARRKAGARAFPRGTHGAGRNRRK